MSHKSNNFQQVNFRSAFILTHTQTKRKFWKRMHTAGLQFTRFATIVCVIVLKDVPNNNRAAITASTVAAPLASTPPTVMFTYTKKLKASHWVTMNGLLFVCGAASDFIIFSFIIPTQPHKDTTTITYSTEYALTWFGLAWLGFKAYVCSQWMFNDPTNLYE